MKIAGKLCPPLVALLAFAFNSSTLFGRAGGGGSFHGGGGGHSFGGGGHSSGGGGGFYFGGGSSGGPIDTTEVVIFIIIFLCVVIYHLCKDYSPSSDDSSRDFEITRPPPPAQTNAASTLQQSDPSFDPAAFYARIQTAFLALQNAWSSQNLDSVRPFISDAILERFTLQFGEQKFLGYQNLLKNVTIQSIALVLVESDHLYDTATVRIHASAIDMNINPDGSPYKPNPGSPIAQPFTEYWSFLRKRGTKSIPTGLIEGNCPNCGGSVAINQNANCPHCKASLRNGQYDWVLTEITQADQWSPISPGHIPGLAALVRRDPNFTTADLEDRASVMFWRLSLADRTASPNPLRKIASLELLYKYAARFVPDSHGNRRLYLDAGVGSVNTLQIVPGGPAADASDYALVEICWSGILYTLSPTTPPHRSAQDDLLHSWYLLKRSAAALTDLNTAISSAHCPNCGAPLSNDASNACEFCNTPLTDGSHGWILTKITARNDPDMRLWLNQQKPPA